MKNGKTMKNIFTQEEEVILQAEELLNSNRLNTSEAETHYRSLLEAYKSLLKQMMKTVKISDIMQLELKNMSYKLKVASQTDVLTGLYNRRFFNEVYLREWKNAVRVKSSLALLMIDIDYFKKYNDTYGHLQGDECLFAVAREIQSAVKRPRDVAARFGGEEFIVLLPETDSEGAAIVAQTLMDSIANLNLEHAGSPLTNRLTVSIGIADIIPEDASTMDCLLNRVDAALYTAKNAGRNCYWFYSE